MLGRQVDRSLALDEALMRIRGHLPSVLQEDRVIGALLCGMAFAWHTDNQKITTFSNQLFHQFVLYSSDEYERREFLAQWKRHMARLQDWVRFNL